MTIRTIAMVLAAGAAAAEAKQAPLFELVPVPPEYAPAPMPTPTPTPAPRRRARRTVPPPPVYVPMPMPPSIPVYVQAPPAPMPPPPAPPPPEPPMPATRLAPIGNPGGWVVNDDYPAAALRLGQSGTVSFKLYVDETGKVAACVVTGSSGAPILDTTTCSLMRRRARFSPARDAAGNPITATYSNRLRWEIPDEPRVPVTSWSSTLRFTIGADSQVLSCGYQGFGAPEIEERSPCVEISEVPIVTMRKLRGTAKGPVTIYARFDHEVAGMPLPRVPALPARFKPVTSWSGAFDIALSGLRGACTGTIDNYNLPMPAVTCYGYTSYGPQTEVHSVVARISFYTDGDANIAAVLPLLGAPAD